MFDIEYKGANAVVFTTKKTRVVFDPKVSVAGGKDVAVAGDIEVATEERFVVEKATPKLLIHGPGEYEVGGVVLTGVAARRHIDTEEQGVLGTVYRMVIDGIRIAIIGNIASKLDEEQLETLGVVDMAVVPIGGGGYTLDATDAAAMVRQIEPRAVIPVHYSDPELSYEVPQEEFDVFVKELGVGIIEAGPKHKIKNDSSIPDQMTIVKIARS